MKIVHCREFFATKHEAIDFKKQHGGTLYSGAHKSKTRSNFMTEVFIAGRSIDFAEQHPYCVAWNESEED